MSRLEKLNRFKAVGDSRRYLDKLNRVGDFLVATDGHTLAYANALSDDQEQSNQLPANLKTILDGIFKAIETAEFIELPDECRDIATQVCTTCRGSGTVWQCYECYGETTVDLENDWNTYDDIDCRSCRATGWVVDQRITSQEPVTCPNCIDGETVGATPIEINDVFLNPGYLRRILDLAGLMVSPHPKDLRLYFKSEELSGVILGVRHTKAWHEVY